jgi:D-alanyl-D-alanine carboxypeptidase
MARRTGPDAYAARIDSLLASLQVPQELISGRALRLQTEADELVVAEIGRNGREHLLVPAAAEAWRAMRAAALADGIEIEIVSAFRSVDRQAEIVRDKLGGGLTPEEIFIASAPPGYSEHHTGRAVDVGTPDARALEQVFGETAAYRWLLAHAGEFSFTLSYPRGNASGYAFEPWHWCYRSNVTDRLHIRESGRA